MINKPDIDLLKNELPDVQIIEEIGSGGFKVVYKAVIEPMLEGMRLYK